MNKIMLGLFIIGALLVMAPTPTPPDSTQTPAPTLPDSTQTPAPTLPDSTITAVPDPTGTAIIDTQQAPTPTVYRHKKEAGKQALEVLPKTGANYYILVPVVLIWLGGLLALRGFLILIRRKR